MALAGSRSTETSLTMKRFSRNTTSPSCCRWLTLAQIPTAPSSSLRRCHVPTLTANTLCSARSLLARSLWRKSNRTDPNRARLLPKSKSRIAANYELCLRFVEDEVHFLCAVAINTRPKERERWKKPLFLNWVRRLNEFTLLSFFVTLRESHIAGCVCTQIHSVLWFTQTHTLTEKRVSCSALHTHSVLSWKHESFVVIVSFRRYYSDIENVRKAHPPIGVSVYYIQQRLADILPDSCNWLWDPLPCGKRTNPNKSL